MNGDRLHRRWHRRHCGLNQGGPPMFFGVVLVTLGTLFLLDNLGWIEARYFFRTFWPLLIVGWGLSRLLYGQGERLIPSLAIGGGVLLLGNELFGWDLSLMRVLWPLLLIAIGVKILSRAARHPRAVYARTAADGAAFVDSEPGTPDAGVSTDSSSTLNEFAMLGGVERRNVSQTFRGGDATAVMGSIEIDFRECRMASDEAVVDVFVFMGNVEIRIPRDWTLESQVSAIMASFEDRTDAPIDASAKRFVVRGSAFMGNVEIRN